MELTSTIIVIVVYFIASFFGSLIGGVALLTIPLLIFIGLSPHAAIGTNRIGSLGLSSGSSLGYGMEERINYNLGSIFGSFLILSIPENIIKNKRNMVILPLSIINRFVFYTFFAFSLIESAALSLFANMASSILSLVIFPYFDAVQYSLFIPIFVASFAGACLGAKYGTKISDDAIKRILLAASIIIATVLLVF